METHGISSLALPFLNLGILVAFLFYKLRAPVKGFVRTRHSSLSEELKDVREKLRLAQVQYEEFTAKLRVIDVEVKALLEQSRREADARQAKILAEVKTGSGAMLAEARLSVNAIFEQLKKDTRAEFGTQVLDRAEKILKDRLTGEDKVRIRKEFSNQLGSAGGAQ